MAKFIIDPEFSDDFASQMVDGYQIFGSGWLDLSTFIVSNDQFLKMKNSVFEYLNLSIDRGAESLEQKFPRYETPTLQTRRTTLRAGR